MRVDLIEEPIRIIGPRLEVAQDNNFVTVTSSKSIPDEYDKKLVEESEVQSSIEAENSNENQYLQSYREHVRARN